MAGNGSSKMNKATGVPTSGKNIGQAVNKTAGKKPAAKVGKC